MYENVTYEGLLDRMLQRAKEHSPGIDTRPSSPIYAAVAPAGVELQNAYIELDWMLGQIFANTADRDYLIQRSSEWGIVPHPATKAVLKGEFNIDVDIGSRFSIGVLNFAAIERISDGIFRMECETAGSDGNRNLGTLVPIDYIPGLTRAELTEVLEEGTDEETTESLRSRLLQKIRLPSTSGNKYDYYNWAMECAGVGAAKVFPLADGPGTVKVVIANSSMGAAEPGLVSEVYDYIEERRPIGATLSVVSAREKAIGVEANVKLRNGVALGTAQNQFRMLLDEHLKANAFQAAYISVARIGNLLLDVAGVEDYSGLALNGTQGNVTLQDEEVAVAGIVRLGVM